MWSELTLIYTVYLRSVEVALRRGKLYLAEYAPSVMFHYKQETDLNLSSSPHPENCRKTGPFCQRGAGRARVGGDRRLDPAVAERESRPSHRGANLCVSPAEEYAFACATK